MGPWIEIRVSEQHSRLFLVVPHVGTWIEMYGSFKIMYRSPVVPHVGTWIEMLHLQSQAVRKLSFPTWERGLK